jgi:anaerobic selenocysteine-containing dehydrogenase/Fe-S-cluster-containing dehydrogenase component
MMEKEKNNGFDRRTFLKISSLGAAATAAGCSSEPANKLIPYLIPPESLVPGVSLWYKSTCRECPAGCGLLVRTREGRTLKVEGNPDHPVNRGKLCIRGQAGVQGLYNPDRIQQPLRRDEHGNFIPATWVEAEALLGNMISYLRYQKQNDQIALWSHRVTGSLDKLFAAFFSALGSKQYQIYEPFAYEAMRSANEVTFGSTEIARFDIASAKVLISFGADFLETWISNTGLAGDFASFRKLKDGAMGKFIHIESRQSLTASSADEWIAPAPGMELFIALAVVHEILKSNLASGVSSAEAQRIASAVTKFDAHTVSGLTDVPADKISSLAHAFASAKPGLALGGGMAAQGSNATATQVAVNLLNYVCGNVGRTVRFGEGTNFDSVATMKDIVAAIDRMNGGMVQLVFFHHANPVYSLPPSAKFSDALLKVPFKVSFSSFFDETAAQCDLVLPDLTPLERWEDYSPRAGVYGIAQPTMQSLLQAKAASDVFLSLSKRVGDDIAKRFPQKSFREFMEENWKSIHKESGAKEDFAEWFRSAVENGGVWLKESTKPVKLNERALNTAFEQARFEGAGDFHLVAYPSLHFFDGRGANRPWLQETPDPLTKIVWDSWLEIHPDVAQRLGIQESYLIRVSSPHGMLQAAAHITKSIRPDTVALPVGQGHKEFGRYAKNRGVNVFDLLTARTEAISGARLWASTKVAIEKLAVNRPLVSTQGNDTQAGREFALALPLTAASKLYEEATPNTNHEEELHMYATHEHPEHRWGMAIDLNSCIGCNACVAACYAENNVAIVGKEQVQRGRHMAWIRIERYFDSEPQNHDVRFLPMLCQQCDNAPCESVCPVYATYHNKDGLNAQIYNRCVGTRYCSNNCPYHVRRFNFFDYEWPYPLTMQLNPDLTVRTKGVMEKCTFCIQRIRTAKDMAKDEHRKVRDGEVIPACGQTCPTEAIVFGDLKDPNSRVSKMSQDPRRYHVLGELNTKSAITYLKKIGNKETTA